MSLLFYDTSTFFNFTQILITGNMAVKLMLVPNMLTDDPDLYYGVVVESLPPKFVMDFENPLVVCGMKIEDGKLVKSDSDEIIETLREGRSIFTPFVNMRICITGDFKGEDDTFDPERHERMIISTVGRQLANDVKTNINKK